MTLNCNINFRLINFLDIWGLKLFYFGSILTKMRRFLDSALATIGYPTVEPTLDPRYDIAAKNFSILQEDTSQIITTLAQLQQQISNVSRICARLGSNLTVWSEEFPENVKNEAITIESFGKQFDNLTTNFFVPRIEPLIVSPLAKFQSEVMRLVEVRKQRDEAVKQYDHARANYKYLSEKKSSGFEKAEAEYKLTKENYEKYNEDFIETVKKLMNQRENGLDTPAKTLIAILSQFLMQLFREAQKFRTTFPEYVLNGGTVERKSIKDIVFADEPIPEDVQYPVAEDTPPA